MSTVFVVGSTNTDMTVRVPRIPAPGETTGGRDFRVSGGGKGANQAIAAARAGALVRFVTAVGTDDFGDRALAALAVDGVDVELARRVPGVASGVALIVVDDLGENAIAVAAGANAELHPDDIAPLAERLDPGDVVLLQLEIPLDTVIAAAQLARARGATVLLNPAPAPAGGLPDVLLEAVTLIAPNEREAEQLTGIRLDDGAGLADAAAAFHRRGVAQVLITLGRRGVYVSGDGATHLPAFPATAIDTTAAGDVFCGTLAVALTEGRPIEAAARFAAAAAAISVTRPGAQASAPHRAEIDALLQPQPHP